MYQVFTSVEAEPIFKGIKGRTFIYRFLGISGGIMGITIICMIMVSLWFFGLSFLILLLLRYYEKISSKKRYNIQKKGLWRPKAILIKNSNFYKSLTSASFGYAQDKALSYQKLNVK
jgi:uncharacterized membrane protein